MTVRRLILRSFQSPGDVLMLTAAVRDLQRAAPGRFEIDVRTSAPDLWLNNPHLTRLSEGQPGVETLEMHYPLIHQSNQRPYHFLHGYTQDLEQKLGLRIAPTEFRGDLHLSREERDDESLQKRLGIWGDYWVLVAGGKYDFTAKWWNPASWQAVVDHFAGRVQFVQCGEKGHWHPKLTCVVDAIGKTTTREFVRLVHRATGVACGVTFAMHLAAAVESPPGRPPKRPCVVVAGGREPPNWEAYPGHQFLHTVGALPCCAAGGCWKSRCQKVGDGDEKDRANLCERPVSVAPELSLPACMEMITPQDVIRAIELYYRGGILSERSAAPQIDVAQPIAAERTRTANRTPSRAATNGAAMAGRNADLTATAVLEPEDREEPRDGDDVPVASEPSASRTPVLIEFRHGLGDAVQLTIVLKHLRRQQPDWDVDVAALPGKHTAFHGLCRRAIVLDRDPSPEHRRYSQVFRLDWHECRTAYRNWPSTKPSRCLLEVFQTSPDPDLCRYEIAVGEDARRRADGYLASVAATGPNPEGRYPVVLLHYQGNTSEDRKNLSHETAREICEAAIRSGRIPVILDWDRRSPLPDGARIHCPGADDPLWSGLGTGDAETLAALIGAAELMVGIDSGPLHVAGATSTPTLAVWVGHHPVHFFDLAPNVLHLVPSGGNGAASGPAALEYFQKQYASHTYLSLNVDIPAMVEHKLTGESLETVANKRFLAQLRAKSYGEAYYEEHRRAGLDYLNYGGWQQEYGRWLVESLDLKGKRLLDVGSACGAILRGLGQAGAVVQGVEINEYMVRLGRQKWPDMACLMHICDAVNLHLFDDGEWDAIHTAQVAEHWKPQLVPHILDELHRVVKPDGLLFCSLDTTELFARQGRTMAHEDPTHVCIQTMAWWRTRLAEAGWDDVTTTWEPRLREHPGAFLQKYDWDWFVARRRP